MAARGRLLLSSIAVVGALLPGLRRAHASEKDRYIVVLDIEGERAPRLKKSITKMVRSQNKVMDGSAYRDAARRLRADKLIPVNIKRVCSYLEADGIVDGTLVKEDGRYKFTLRIRSGVTGAITKKIPMYINQPTLSVNMASQLEERVLAAIDALPRIGGDDAGGSKAHKRRRGDDGDDDADQPDEPAPLAKARRGGVGGKDRKMRGAAVEDEEQDEEQSEEAPRSARGSKLDRDKDRGKARGKDSKGKPRRAEDEEESDPDIDAAALAEAAHHTKMKGGKRAAMKDAGEEEEDEDRDDHEKAGSGRGKPKAKRAAAADAGDGEADDRDDADEGDDRDDSDDGDDGGRARAGDSPEAEAEATASKPGGPTSPRTTPLLIEAGLSATKRTLSFNYSGNAADAPAGYKDKTVPGGLFDAELYPLAFSNEGAMANVGVGVVADRVLKLQSAVNDSMGVATELPTRESRYGARLIYRHNFGSGPEGFSLKVSVGYNKASFVIDKSQAPEMVVVDVPNVVYTYVDPGAEARIPIAGPVSALVGAKFLAVLGTGEIQAPDQYGSATVTGVDADGSLEVRVGDHFLVRGGARLMLMGFKFKGTGSLTDRDGNAATDVGGASDRYLGGYLLGGYAF